MEQPKTAVMIRFVVYQSSLHNPVAFLVRVFFKGTMQFFALTACSMISGASLHTGGEPQISQTDRETGKRLYCI